jgi:ketosteroid isomerase-like protein
LREQEWNVDRPAHMEAIMSEQENIHLVRQCYEAFLNGETERMLNYMMKSIDWELPAVEGIPFSGKRQGRDAVAEFFRLVNELQELREFRPKEFIAQGDRVVVTGHYEWTVKATRAEFGCDWCHVFHIAMGEISKFTEFTDTHKAALAYQPQAADAMKAAARPGADRPTAH